MTNVLDMAEDDADHGPKINPDGVKASIAKMAERQVNLSNEIAELEQRVKDLKKDLQRVEEQDLPEAMDQIGMAEFKLLDGTKISVKTFYHASISAERKPEAFSWLDENGHGALIKTEVTTSFGKGELETAKEFLEYSRGWNGGAVEPQLEQGVYWQTLRAFVKEQIEDGGQFPQDLFGVYIGRKAHIKK